MNADFTRIGSALSAFICVWCRFIKPGYIHNHQTGGDCNDLEGNQPQNGQDEKSPYISGDNELEKNDRNHSDHCERAVHESFIVADNDPPATIFTVKMKGV